MIVSPLRFTRWQAMDHPDSRISPKGVRHGGAQRHGVSLRCAVTEFHRLHPICGSNAQIETPATVCRNLFIGGLLRPERPRAPMLLNPAPLGDFPRPVRQKISEIYRRIRFSARTTVLIRKSIYNRHAKFANDPRPCGFRTEPAPPAAAGGIVTQVHI